MRKSEWSAQLSDESLKQADIVLGDTMGEMFTYYAIADVVLMGGTWLPYGGQNFLEPMALGKPVIVGESIYNFEQIGLDALEKGVLWQAQNLDDAFILSMDNMGYRCDPNSSLNKNAHKIRLFVQYQLGVSDKLLKWLLN